MSNPQPLKVLSIGMGWFPEQAGGLDRFYYDCVEHLPQANIDMHGLVTGSLNVNASTNNKIQSFSPTAISLPNRWAKVRAAVKQARQNTNYPLITSHFALYTLPVLGVIRDLPLVIHFQGPWALESKFEGSSSLATYFKKQIEQLTYNRGNQFIVLSQAFQDLLHQEYGVPIEKIHIIPAAVSQTRYDIPQTTQEARTQLNWPQDRPILLSVRRLSKRMGLENLISAMAEVRQHHPTVLLHIAGKGKQATALQDQINSLNLQNNVRLLGYVPDEDLNLAYRAADLSIVPTLGLEGFGLIIIEALSAGTPVLGTPISSIPEILGPLSPNLLFQSAEPHDIAQGITQALSGELKLPTSDECKAYVKTHYDWQIVATKIRAVYDLAIATASR
jgi:glycosyltransferase involved in cell wall biosynthesis